MKVIDIEVARTIPAPAEMVFDVWMNPNSPGSIWFGAEKVILNATVDGLFYWAVQHEGRAWPHYGRFLGIDRPNSLEHTWVSEATKGLESVVSISFEPRGDETEVRLRHSGIPDDEMGRKHKDGWTWCLSMLAERFASAPVTAVTA
jgi:uncharacterized protein YndB with AHSA1/START domain